MVSDAVTFDPAWMHEHGIESIESLPIPGRPMMMVTHQINGVLFKFMAFIIPPDFAGPLPDGPQAILEQAARQILRGIAQRRATLTGTFI